MRYACLLLEKSFQLHVDVGEVLESLRMELATAQRKSVRGIRILYVYCGIIYIVCLFHLCPVGTNGRHIITPIFSAPEKLSVECINVEISRLGILYNYYYVLVWNTSISSF